VQIRASIRSGSVYYFTEESFSSSEPHYFIVLNHTPATDEVLLLVCSSSRIESVRRRRRQVPKETLVEISHGEYPEFTVDSIIDCNSVITKNIEELVDKLKVRKLKFKTEIGIEIVRELRFGVLASPLVAEEIKDLLI